MAKRLAFLYPGQGALPERPLPDLFPDDPDLAELYASASGPLTPPVAEFSRSAEPAELRAQAGVLASGFALGEMMRRRGIEPRAMAGYSSGVYTALAGSGAARPGEMANIVQTAYSAIRDCCPEPDYQMLAVIGLSRHVIEGILGNLAAPGWVSLINNASQMVVSLPQSEAGAFAEKCRQAGALKLVELPFHKPYHAPPLKPAGQALTEELWRLSLKTPRIPVMAGTDPHVLEGGRDIARTVGEQLFSPVEWEKTVNQLLAMGMDGLVCLDPSGGLTRIVLWITRRVPVYGLAGPRDLARLLAGTGG